MRRRTTLIAALGLSALLSAAACGGSSQPPAALPAGGAQGTTAARASASPTASVAGQLPSDFKVDIEITPTGDATKDGLLSQARALIMAYEQAVSRNNPSDSLYQSMTSQRARLNLYSMIDAFRQAGRRPSGSERFYQFSALPQSKVPAADVLFCDDSSKVVPVGLKSGKPVGAAATGSAARTWWDVGFEKSSGGTWNIVYAATQVGRQSCM